MCYSVLIIPVASALVGAVSCGVDIRYCYDLQGADLQVNEPKINI